MNLQSIESSRTQITRILNEPFSERKLIFELSEYFCQILKTNNKNIVEAYVLEFMEVFVNKLKKYEVFGISPDYTTRLISNINKLTDVNILEQFKAKIISYRIDIENNLTILKNTLNGLDIEEKIQLAATFPVLEILSNDKIPSGYLDSISIHLKKAKNKQKFIIVPSQSEIENKLNTQLSVSWNLAIKVAQKYLGKSIEPFDVVIEFDKKLGFYEGNSLGVLITVCFLEEILKYYNSHTVIECVPLISVTGGLGEYGKIANTSGKIIKQKTEIVFFSNTKLFVIPNEEVLAANEKLIELKKKFPKRDLQIVGIEDFTDFLNRRNIVEIKKQPIIVRGRKFVKKNWVALSLIFILVSIVSLFIIKDIDTNPASFTADGERIYIKNKSGKVLWKKDIGIDDQYSYNPRYLNSVAKIIDIDSDGINEVIICREISNSSPISYNNLVTCYNSESKIIWRYTFSDSMDFREDGEGIGYGTIILDTLTIFGEKCLFLISSSLNSYRSAIYRIRLSDAQRLKGTLWSSGHVISAFIKKIDPDFHPDIFALGYDNGYKDVVFFAYQPDTLTAVRLTLPKYLIKDYPLAELKAYLRFPKTDYEIMYHRQTPLICNFSFLDDVDLRKYKFAFADVLENKEATIGYEISYDFDAVNIVIDSDFKVERDSLVEKNILSKPKTGSDEYMKALKRSILFWQNGRWLREGEF